MEMTVGVCQNHLSGKASKLSVGSPGSQNGATVPYTAILWESPKIALVVVYDLSDASACPYNPLRKTKFEDVKMTLWSKFRDV